MKLEHAQTLQILNALLGRGPLPTHVDNWQATLAYAKTQGLQGIVAHALQQIPDLPPEARSSCQAREFAVIGNSCERAYAFAQIEQCFEQAQVAYLPVKGQVVQQAYPIPDLREMGDVDIVIHRGDKQRVAAVFAKAGYQLRSSSAQVDTFSKGNLCFEVHTQLFPLLAQREHACGPYLSDALWERAQRQGGTMQHRLSKQAECILMLLHMASHFYDGGCGLRFFLDIAVFRRAFEKEISWPLVLQTLHILGFEAFSRYVLSAVAFWFGTPLPKGMQPLRLCEKDEMQRMVLEHGTYGLWQRGNTSRGMKAAAVHRGFSRSGTAPVRLHVSLPLAAMQKRYGYVKRCPLLYPVALAHRCFQWLRRQNQRDGVLAGAQHLVAEREEIAQEMEQLKRIGL